MRQINGKLEGRGLRACLLAARFNESVVLGLVEGARRGLLQHGVSEESIELIWVPGAFELPAALAARLAAGPPDLVVALGAVIRGQTPHFEFVAQAACSGLAEVARSARVPLGFGVLTVNSPEQAAERAGGKLGNKGWEAACAALEMASVLAQMAPG